MKRFIPIGWIVLLLIAACAAPPPQSATQPDQGAATGETQPEPEGTEGTKDAAEPKPATKPPVAATPATPAQQKEAQKFVRRAFELLDAGEVDKARADLEHAEELDPENRQLGCLLRGMNADLATVGSEYTAYTVKPGESLGAIAQRYMNDVCEFYLLARYNQIRVPKQLAAGQTIRIPGRIKVAAPPPQPVYQQPLPQAAVVAPVTVPKPTPAVAEKKPAAPVEHDPREIRAQVDRRHRIAQDAYRRQDLATAIREWDAVLALDPGHNAARVGRQQALDLQDRLEKIKKK